MVLVAGWSLAVIGCQVPPVASGRIAFETYRDGNAEVYLMDADGSNLVNLTNHPADDIHPQWQPQPEPDS